MKKLALAVALAAILSPAPAIADHLALQSTGTQCIVEKLPEFDATAPDQRDRHLIIARLDAICRILEEIRDTLWAEHD